jgi:hypothetical protein
MSFVKKLSTENTIQRQHCQHRSQHWEAATISTLVHNAVQVNTGIFIIVMPGARILTMVTIRLTPGEQGTDTGNL